MRRADRQIAFDRTYALFEQDPAVQIREPVVLSEASQYIKIRKGLSQYLYQAGLDLSPSSVIVISIVCGILVCWGSCQLFAWYLAPVFFIAGASLPFFWCEHRVRVRASQFSADYPAVLMATASSLKAGMTALAALERSVRLLRSTSLVKKEVESLLAALSQGVPKVEALGAFADSVRQPDLELFRTAFSLVLDHGGRFAPTLERLARVCRDRSILIRSAQVSTATMRMTACVLLAMVPFIVTMVAARTENFWDVLINHPVANTLASIGVTVIGISLLALIRMSRFRP